MDRRSAARPRGAGDGDGHDPGEPGGVVDFGEGDPGVDDAGARAGGHDVGPEGGEVGLLGIGDRTVGVELELKLAVVGLGDFLLF